MPRNQQTHPIPHQRDRQNQPASNTRPTLCRLNPKPWHLILMPRLNHWRLILSRYQQPNWGGYSF
jgi:hypothetical protein